MSDWFDGAGNGAAVAVPELFDDLALAGMLELVSHGALVSIGLTSDGGAVSFTVTVDGRWRREYFRDGELLVAWIAEAIPAVQHARQAAPASGGGGNGSRRRRGL
jgi:hypothetical protein